MGKRCREEKEERKETHDGECRKAGEIFNLARTPPFPPAPVLCKNRRVESDPSTNPQPADEATLRLIPEDDSPPIHLVARAQFRIGRSPDDADWITRFLPETDENLIFTNEIGRVHVLGEIIDGLATVRDGNGVDASINGSTFDGEKLTADAATLVQKRGVLTLGELYAVDLVPLFAEPGDFLLDGNPAAQAGGAQVCGAIVFAQRLFAPTLRDAAWIFTRLDFALRPDGGPAWLAPQRENSAAFLRRDGNFWLANMGLPVDALGLDGESIGTGEAVSLAGARSLRLGAREYAVEIE